MSIRLVRLAFNSGRQMAMVSFYRALGAELQVKQIKKGSESYQGRIGSLDISIYAVDKKYDLTTPNFSMCLEVDNIEATLHRIRQVEEATMLMEIEILHDAKKAIVLDPDGHAVEIIEAPTGQKPIGNKL